MSSDPTSARAQSEAITPPRLEALLAAATPGPWAQNLVDETLVIAGRQEIASTNVGGTYDDDWRRMAADAALIALTPSLAARVIELEAQNARLTGALKAVAGPHGYDPPARQDLQAIARTALEPDA